MRKRKWEIAAAAAFCAAVLLYACWYQGLFLPRWILWRDREVSGRTACLSLEKRRLRLLYGDAGAADANGTAVWEPPSAWPVQDAFLRDIDRDGKDELVLLVWKHGSYGRHRPSWVTRDTQAFSQHIFIYRLDEGSAVPRPIWMSSALDIRIRELLADDRGRVLVTEPDGTETWWGWRSWGLRRLSGGTARTVRLIAFGDLLAHTPILRYGMTHGDNYDFLFARVREEIEASDLAAINQETPLVDDPAAIGDYPRFGTPAEVGEAIAEAGFDIVSCATNHMTDRGSYGIGVTADCFARKGVMCLGIHPAREAAEMQKPAEEKTTPEGEQESEKETESAEKGAEPNIGVYGIQTIEANHISFALLNYTYGLNGSADRPASTTQVDTLLDRERVLKALDAARNAADMTVVFVHWGTEYSDAPDETQEEWTRIFLAHGVDLVIGTHPHVLQPYEMLTGADGHRMLVYYSLGNFISAQEREECRTGGMADVTIERLDDGSCAVTGYGLKEVEAYFAP